MNLVVLVYCEKVDGSRLHPSVNPKSMPTSKRSRVDPGPIRLGIVM